MEITIQFCGDIMSDAAQNQACKIREGYCYQPVFKQVQTLLHDCDYLVGNLETPVAGYQFGFTDRQYQFNTPIELLDALKECGFSLLSLANNHCMDRGIEGLYSTLDNLDNAGLEHIGTYRSKEERDIPYIVKIGDIRFGFLSYTYGTNAFFHHLYLPDDAKFAVNLLQPEEKRKGAINLLEVDNVAQLVHELYEQPNPIFDLHIKSYLDQLSDDVEQLRQKGAEYLIMLLHCGGQHNLKPDSYTKWIVEHIRSLGVDLVICNHQHILHPIVNIGKFRVAYCLGNFSSTPGRNPNALGVGEEYTIVLRIKFTRTNGEPSISKISFQMMCNVINEVGISEVRPLFDLIGREDDLQKREEFIRWNQHFVNLILGQEAPVIPQQEYNYPLDRMT